MERENCGLEMDETEGILKGREVGNGEEIMASYRRVSANCVAPNDEYAPRPFVRWVLASFLPGLLFLD